MTRTVFAVSDTVIYNWINGNRSDVKALFESLKPLEAATVAVHIYQWLDANGLGDKHQSAKLFDNWLVKVVDNNIEIT